MIFIALFIGSQCYGWISIVVYHSIKFDTIQCFMTSQNRTHWDQRLQTI